MEQPLVRRASGPYGDIVNILERPCHLLRQRERSDDPDRSTPAERGIVTHPFYNTMFCTRMAAPALLGLKDVDNLWVDSPLQDWMERVIGYTPDTQGKLVYNAHPDFDSTMSRLKNIVAVLVVACAEQNHSRIISEIQAVLDVFCWTKYFMTKRRFLFPNATDSHNPPLVAFWRYEDMQRVSETTAAEGSVKWVVNSMFCPVPFQELLPVPDPLEDCASVYHHLLSRLANWKSGSNMPLSIFCYGMQAVLLRALHHYFPNIIGKPDHREELSVYWSCTLHREIECTFQKRQMMANQILPEYLEAIGKRRCKNDREKRVVMQTYVPEMFKGCPNIGLLTTKLEVLAPNNGLAKGKAAVIADHANRVPTQPRFYNACVYWRLLAEWWHSDTPVIQADWCTDERRAILCELYDHAVQKSQVHKTSVKTVDRAVAPALAKEVQRLTAKQSRDEQEERLRSVQKRTKARLERRLHTSLTKLQQQQQKEQADAQHSDHDTDEDEDDDGGGEEEVRKIFPSFAEPPASKEKRQPAKKEQHQAVKAGTKRKRAPRTWTNTKSHHHHKCLQLIQQLKFDVVQCLPYYGRFILACHTRSCHVEPPLNTDDPHEPAMSNPEKLALQTHTRKRRVTFSDGSKKRASSSSSGKTRKPNKKDDVSVVKKPSPTGPIRAFLLRLFQTTVNDPVWREPILSHRDVASALVLCRDRDTKQFKFAYSVPRDLSPWFSLRFRELPPDLPVTTVPQAYEALNLKGGFGDASLRAVLKLDGKKSTEWDPWRCFMCSKELVCTEEIPETTFTVQRVTSTVYCVSPTGRELTPFELTLLQHKSTFKRLAERDLITWYLVLGILYWDWKKAYQELRLIRPTLTPWNLERAFLQYDKTMKRVLAKATDQRPAATTLTAYLARIWAAHTEKHHHLLEYYEPEEGSGANAKTRAAIVRVASKKLEAARVLLGEIRDEFDDISLRDLTTTDILRFRDNAEELSSLVDEICGGLQEGERSESDGESTSGMAGSAAFG